MNKNILAIGQSTDQKRNVFSGQSMMFDAMVDYLEKEQHNVSVVNLTSKYQAIKVGKISFKRIMEYYSIILKSIPQFLKNRKGIMYITTAQTKGGFMRDFIFISLAKLFGYEILLQQFGSNFNFFYNSVSSPFQKMIKRTFEKGRFIIVEGEVTKRQFSMIKEFKTKVIPVTNGLPEKNITEVSIGKKVNHNSSFNLIYLSYLIESKGYWDVLEAMDILINTYHLNVSCVFSGMFKPSVDDERYLNEIDAEKAFFKFIEDKNLKDFIVYKEGLMGHEKAQAFLKANVFLLPSYFKFEGQPVSVLEAMAYGCIPIVTNYRMIPDMVTEETGIFVEKQSPLQIAKGIKYLIENEKDYNRMSQANIDRYKNKFTLERYCSSINDIIKKM